MEDHIFATGGVKMEKVRSLLQKFLQKKKLSKKQKISNTNSTTHTTHTHRIKKVGIHSIRVKLIAAFLILIIPIIILGTESHRLASSKIENITQILLFKQ